MGLKTYKTKRNFTNTPEPKGAAKNSGKELRFVVQKHNASRLHYDFRLEMEGVLKSWAVPKGPSLNPDDKRLAVMVEDHPYDYRTFKGIIPEGNYGAGTVEIFDEGTYIPLEKSNGKKNEAILLSALKKGDLKFILKGKKLRGAFALVQMHDDSGKNWLLIKKKDEHASKSYNIEKIVPLKSLSESAKAKFENQKVVEKKSSRIKKKALPTNKSEPTANRSTSKKKFKNAVNDLAKPMLTHLIKDAFDDPQWIYEYKWDGYRTIAAVDDGKVELISRNNLSLNHKFAPIAKELEVIEDTAIIDGEVVALNDKGTPQFQLLQRFKHVPKGKLAYYIFDLLYLNGQSLVQFELKDRKELLQAFFNKYDFKSIIISEYIAEKGKDLFAKAKKQELEGIIAKDAHSIYLPGQRSTAWKKIKTSMQQEVIICGYTAPNGSRKKFGSLVLGVYEKNELKCIGHCGSGFTDQSLIEVYNKMQPFKQVLCPFKEIPVLNAETTWLKPKLICEVKFVQWTNEGQLRNAVFKGLRIDKSAKEIKMEIPDKTPLSKKPPVENKNRASALKKSKPERSAGKKPAKKIIEPASSVAGQNNDEIKIKGNVVKVTNLQKIYWPKEKYTKGHLIEYYKNVAGMMLPYLKDRPHSLNRFPNGIDKPGFYQKDVEPKQLPDYVKTLSVHSESGNKYIDYMLCQNEASLVYMANLGCIEINPWNSRQNKIGNPDWMVIDLDPADNTFRQVIKTALVTKQIFDAIHVDCYCKTSGATGLHIYVPFGARYDYDHTKNFAEIVANLVHQQLPDITSVDRTPAKRKKKIYVDFLQNRRGQTLAAPYCVRPKAGATVSTPLRWEEVNNDLSPSLFTMFNIMTRLEKTGDLWKPVLGKGVDMQKALKAINDL